MVGRVHLVGAAAVASLCLLTGTGRALTPPPAPTPTACDSSGARLELTLSATPMMPVVGDVVDLEVLIANPSGRLAGLPSYSLSGVAPAFAAELIEGTYPYPTFARFRLTAIQSGRAALVASVYYETSHDCFGSPIFFFRSSSSEPFEIEVVDGGPTPTPTPTQATATATDTPTSNRPPPVGVVRVVPNPAHGGDRVGLDSAGSSGAINGRYWRQLDGPPVALQECTPAADFGCYGSTAWFVAPAVDQPTTLRFELLLTSYGATSWDWTQFDVTVLPPGCSGDCDGDNRVTVAELVAAVAIALGEADLGRCPAADTDASGVVAIDDLTAALRDVLDGCG